MTDLTFLADDGLVDALLMEVAGLLRRLIEQGEQGSIDLLGLPLSPACVAALDQRLGQGEITVLLECRGPERDPRDRLSGSLVDAARRREGTRHCDADRGCLRAGYSPG
ncbi:MAG: hydrogenase expression/formation C-terminal domain-containing protein [Acetobacteraceae bacterium]